MTETGVVFDVQRFSIHDGPGIRTVVFFKGCSLRCEWCQNPESLRPRPELAFYADRCLDCGTCATTCTRDAITSLADGRVARERCDDCGECAATCPGDALRMVGRAVGIDELVRECVEDDAFARASGGGVTLSGGEPVLQSPFAAALLRRLREQRVHTLVETAGAYPWRMLAPLLPFVDEIYFDWKLPSPDAYARHARGDGDRVLTNLARLVREHTGVTVRVPLLPTLNTNPAQVARLAATLTDVGVTAVQLLRYHRLWRAKLPRLRPLRHVPTAELAATVDEAAVVAAFAAGGVHATAPPGAAPVPAAAGRCA